MAKLYSLARMTTATTGTGTITLGSAVSGFLSFAGAGIADGETVTYAISDGSNSEIGRGVYTSSGTTLTRSVLKSTNSNTAINLSGSAQVLITPAAEDFLREINAQTDTTYTVVPNDLGKLVTYSNASAVAVTLPQATGSFAAGWYHYAQNKGAGTVTITPTTSTINGAATLVLAQNEGVLIVSDGTNYQVMRGQGLPVAGGAFTGAVQFTTLEVGHASDTTLSRSAAGELAVEGVVVKKVGKETIWVPAAAMTARTTNGAASGTTELATNDVMLRSFDFDTATEEGVGFMIAMPKSWNESTVTFVPYWTAASGSGGVVFGLAAYAFSDDDAMDTAVSGQQTSTDTLITANDCHVGPESSAITIGGTPAANDLVYFEVTREVADGSDTLGVDAKLLGIRLHITTDASTDA